MSILKIDTKKKEYLLDGKPIKNVEKIDIEITAFNTKVTMLIANCEVQFAMEGEFKKNTTSQLVEELKKRAGVITEIAEPYIDRDISVNGPATILVVID